jgi:FAD/FMN-containing dehydrogenase/Fe-S oxidoreductase
VRARPIATIAEVSVEDLIGRLRGQIAGTIRADRATRELYASDASLYRRRPAAVLRAARADDLAAAMDAAAAAGVPLTLRGAGTSLAGQSVGTGLIVDCGALSSCEIDPGARIARVGPGVVLDDLNREAGRHGLMFGPDVATANRATLGGMIGNNSAGARSIVYGLTADRVAALDVVLADGTRTTLRRGRAVPAVLEACRPLADAWSGPALLRRVSGYNLDALAGDAPDWPRLVCGSEGTLALIVGAELVLDPVPAARGLGLVGFADVDAALAAVVDILPTGPSAVELMDAAMLDPANRAPLTARLTAFGRGLGALLVVEYSGAPEQVRAQVAALGDATPVLDAAGQQAVWAVRRAGIARALRGEGLVGSHLPTADAVPLPFIEDPAVPPPRLAGFAREVRRVLDEEELPSVWYGHASVGCLHIRPLLDLRLPGAVARMRRVAEQVADLVVANEGSLSGEHGDGRLRGELLPRMYPPATIAAFAALKDRLDPHGLLNPGVIVRPEPLDDGLRTLAAPHRPIIDTAIGFATEGGFARAVEACNGNAACRSRQGTMCPSFQALGDERHSTRGRAVLLRAAAEGRLEGGLADDGVHEALELCLGCKACATECPASVDMARMKVAALDERWARTGTPLRVRAFAGTHGLLATGSRAPWLAAAGTRLAARMIGRRPPTPRRPWSPPRPPEGRPDLVVMMDTFTRYLHPEVGVAALAVLTAAGVRAAVVDPGCCGRPQYSQGRVAAARRQLGGALDRLAPYAAAGVPIVTLEPSCWSMLTDDAEHLVDDPRAATVAGAVETFEHALLRVGIPELRPMTGRAVVHRHCHDRSGGGPDSLMEVVGAVPGLDVSASGAGCCGMAGSFGYAHPGLSRRIAEDRLAPAARAGDFVVAHGSSCRQQVADVAKQPAVHPAVLIAAQLAD